MNGGLDLAVESVLDSRVSWVAEFDDGPSRILAHRYPHAPNLHDVTQVDWSAVDPVDVITGGSPCQDLSHAGKRAGMKDGTRSGLWAAMCDAVETIRPRLVVWENVRGALSAEATAGDVESCEFCVGDPGEPHLRALGRVLGDLAELGYDAAWAGLRAADVGAPHGRWRIFVLAWDTCRAPDDLDAVLAARLGGRPAARDAAGVGVEGLGSSGLVEPRAHARSGLPLGAGDAPGAVIADFRLLKTPTSQLAVNGGSQHPDKRKVGGHGPTLADEVEHLLPTPRATDGSKGGPNQRGSSGDLMLPSAVTLMPTPRATRGGSGTETMYGLGAARSNEQRTQGVVLMPTPSVADVEGGRKSRSGARSDELLLNGIAAAQRFGDYGPAVARWEAALGRPAPDPTEPTGKDGAHRLSARFVEWMMGLPDGWVTDPAIWAGWKPSTARNAQLKALGNGVVPRQAAAAIRHLLDVRASAVEAMAA